MKTVKSVSLALSGGGTELHFRSAANNLVIVRSVSVCHRVSDRTRSTSKSHIRQFIRQYCLSAAATVKQKSRLCLLPLPPGEKGRAVFAEFCKSGLPAKTGQRLKAEIVHAVFFFAKWKTLASVVSVISFGNTGSME